MRTDVMNRLHINLNRKNKQAIVDGIKSWTYDELGMQVKKMVVILKNAGISSRDRVMLRAESCVEFVVYYLALHNIEAICIPYSASANDSVVSRLQEISKAKYNICGIANNGNVEILQYSCKTDTCKDDEAIADILFTSGTTGVEKAVALTATAIEQAIKNIKSALSIIEEDVVLVPMPLYHSHALGTLRTLLACGATVVITKGIGEMLTMLSRYSCTGISCSPVMIDWIVRSCNDKYEELFEKLRFVEIGTAPLVGESRKRVKKFFGGINIFISYGATEAPRAIYMDISKSDKPYSVGKPVGDYQVKIFAISSEETLQNGMKGRLGLKGKALMTDYLNDRGIVKKELIEGYFLTGDIAYIDSENDINLVDRMNDLLIIGGEKVYPSEIECLLSKIEDVEECVCVGLDTNKMMLGQRIVVFIKKKLHSCLCERDIREYMVTYVENYKIPSKVIFIDEIPRNEMGKVDKNILKNILIRM